MWKCRWLWCQFVVQDLSQINRKPNTTETQFATLAPKPCVNGKQLIVNIMKIAMCPLALIKEHQHQSNLKLSKGQPQTWILNEYNTETITNKKNQWQLTKPQHNHTRVLQKTLRCHTENWAAEQRLLSCGGNMINWKTNPSLICVRRKSFPGGSVLDQHPALAWHDLLVTKM